MHSKASTAPKQDNKKDAKNATPDRKRQVYSQNSYKYRYISNLESSRWSHVFFNNIEQLLLRFVSTLGVQSTDV